MKTTLDWLKEIPDAEVREKAIANYDGKNSDARCNNISEAIYCGFIWRNAKEGADYWNEQYEKYLDYTHIEKYLYEELSEELERHNKAILEILKKHGK